MVNRCAWVPDDEIYMRYHDEEWGVPVYDDRLLFEFLILEGAQAGLSWSTILKYREWEKNLLSGRSTVVENSPDSRKNYLTITFDCVKVGKITVRNISNIDRYAGHLV